MWRSACYLLVVVAVTAARPVTPSPTHRLAPPQARPRHKSLSHSGASVAAITGSGTVVNKLLATSACGAITGSDT